jgi:hypothetical protein
MFQFYLSLNLSETDVNSSLVSLQDIVSHISNDNQ